MCSCPSRVLLRSLATSRLILVSQRLGFATYRGPGEIYSAVLTHLDRVARQICKVISYVMKRNEHDFRYKKYTVLTICSMKHENDIIIIRQSPWHIRTKVRYINCFWTRAKTDLVWRPERIAGRQLTNREPTQGRRTSTYAAQSISILRPTRSVVCN